ncbi:MAG: NTP transferase domain-containing protein [Geminicoccaceae bacterium]|nr:NTP transferase domain-containing protein [Geminicoccaceae bacterium]
MSANRPENVPVFILCGGLGSRLGALAADRPKPMVEIDGEPILQHVMRCYARFGFRRFVLCTGHRDEVIARHFLDFSAIHEDFTVDLATRSLAFHQTGSLPDWQVTIAHTGRDCMTGARLARAASRYMDDAENFALTYADGVCNADLGAELLFHLVHRHIGTVLAVHPQSAYGEFLRGESGLPVFSEKPRDEDRWISGGFFFFHRRFLDYLSHDPDCVLEGEPLARLSREHELALFHHDGFWSSMDTPCDHARMNALCEDGSAPWHEEEADAHR